MSKRIEDKREENVAVAIDKNKGSQYALKWAIDRLLSRGQTLTLVHVKQKSSSVAKPTGNVAIADVKNDVARTYKQEVDTQTRELFLPFRCFCSRKDIKCNEVTLEDTDIAKALIEYASFYAIDNLVLGASSRNTLIKRFRATDIPSSISKGAPSFCNVYVIAKGKISSVRSATTPPPARDPVRGQSESQLSLISDPTQSLFMHNQKLQAANMTLPQSQSLQELLEINSPLTSEKASVTKYEASTADSDLSFMSSGSPSIGRKFPSFSDTKEYGRTSQLSISSASDSDISSFMSSSSGNRPSTSSSHHDFSSSAGSGSGSGSGSWSSQSLNMAEDVEEEMRRLRLELKQTIEMYGAACKEAISAKHKARELHHWKLEDQQRLHEARLAEEAALALAEKEKAKGKAAMEAAESAQKIAELESQKRNYIEMSALKAEVEENQKGLSALTHSDLRYRKYTIEEIEEATEYFASSLKIGEGGYGPVYKCFLDYTPAAVKVLRPDAAHGRSQFQQEVEILCNIRHPNMVILLGACPEYGCLVYEYMGNGSLEDRLFRRGGTPVLPWQLRFRIAAEISTGLLFLHQTKPEPLVHRDLKPANILLDRNYVSKISDVGLARLVPPSVADSVTQYRMTSAAGTFCYIDPEYQQTGMLGIKSDIYALGIMLLQIITAKPPMGLTHLVQRAIDQGSFDQVLDPAVPDWPVEEALRFAKLALQCAELRRKDRPDLGTVVLPELRKLGALADESMPTINHLSSPGSSPIYSQVSTAPQDLDDTESLQSGYASSRSRDSSILSFTERLT